MTLAKTIYGLSSGAGRAGIAVIRISGPRSSSAASRMAGSLPRPRQASYRAIRHAVSGELIDQGLVLWFPGPGSATGEDLVELHLHGSAAVIGSAFSSLSAVEGLEPAEPGEFSRQAFRNGKIDLVEAEGLADLLAAEGDVQRRQALYQMTGAASSELNGWFDEACAILARLEAAIDFIEEEDVAALALDGVKPRVVSLAETMDTALGASERADAVREGVRIAIIGAPNVGKSSLINRLAAREAAIVSPQPGTTRDVIEVRMMLAGLPVTVLDTAGLRSIPADEIERVGIERAYRAAQEAHLVIHVTAPDVLGDFVEITTTSSRISVMNKADLLGENSIHSRNDPQIAVSARSGDGIDLLIEAIEERLRTEFAARSDVVAVRERHRVALKESIRALNESLTFGPERVELAAEAVRGAAHSLARITGRVDVEDLLGRIFSEFCVGK